MEFARDTFALILVASIDVSLHESLDGGYRGVAPMGLFWSMESAAASADGNSSFAKNNSSPDRVDFEAVLDGHVLARASLARNFLAPGTVTRDLKIPSQAEGLAAGARIGSARSARRPSGDYLFRRGAGPILW